MNLRIRMFGYVLMVMAAGMMIAMIKPSWPGAITIAGVGTLLRFGAAELVTGKVHRDRHPYPHRMTARGGCACDCPLCVNHDSKFRRCICPRCSQECPGIGRLGDLDSIAREKPVTYGTPAGRWYLVR